MFLMDIDLAGLKMIGYGIAVVGVAIGVGMIFSAVVSSIARQPEVAGKLQSSGLIGAVIIEALAILAFVLAFIL
ncbi:MAG: ATP synthase F0 subunit C [Propionibacteriaceae bacterium]|jgi:F-type H+-transporting ATPase subunit c|nr:ATP synthase F0 subunit C [Propionibacteriaceae bacterium]